MLKEKETLDQEEEKIDYQQQVKNLEVLKNKLGLSFTKHESIEDDAEFSISEDGYIVIHKPSFNDEEYELAKNYKYRITSTVLRIDPFTASKDSLYYMLLEAIPKFMKKNEGMEAFAKKCFFEKISELYSWVCSDFYYKNILKHERKFKNHKLTKYQREDAVLVCNRRYNFLAYEPGLGKTIVSVLPCKIDQDIKKTVLLCEVNKIWELYYELVNEWDFNKDEITVVDTDGVINAKSEKLILITYPQFKIKIDILLSRKIDYLIINEATNVKNIGTQITKSVLKLINANKNIKITFDSGTPVQNKPDDVFSYLYIIDHLLSRSRRSFYSKYVVEVHSKGRTFIAGGKNLSELKKLLSNFIIRRTKKEVQQEKKIVLNIEKFSLLPKYYDQYIVLRDEIKDEKESDERNNIKKETTYYLKNNNKLRIISATSIAENILPQLDALLKEGVEKLVIFSPWKEPLRLINERFPKESLLIVGNIKSKKRTELRNQFREDPSIKFYLATVDSEGKGCNLQFCNMLWVLGMPPTYSMLDQVKNRIYRLGQKADTLFFKILISQGTIDEKDILKIEKKEKDTRELIAHENDGFTFLTKKKNKSNGSNRDN